MRPLGLAVLLVLSSPFALAQTKTTSDPADPAALGAELAKLGGAAFDRGYLTVAVTRLNATADLAQALATHADAPALRRLGQQQMQAAKTSATLAQTTLKALGGPDLTLANRAQRGLGSFAGGLLGKSDARRSDTELYERLLSARGQLLAGAALAVTRIGDPRVLTAARDLLKQETDAFVALRLGDPR